MNDAIIIATDGLFDNLYDQEIASIVHKSLQEGLTPQVHILATMTFGNKSIKPSLKVLYFLWLVGDSDNFSERGRRGSPDRFGPEPIFRLGSRGWLCWVFGWEAGRYHRHSVCRYSRSLTSFFTLFKLLSKINNYFLPPNKYKHIFFYRQNLISNYEVTFNFAFLF